MPNFNSIPQAVINYSDLENCEIKKTHAHTHTNFSRPQLKITIPDILDYYKYSNTNISNFFMKNQLSQWGGKMMCTMKYNDQRHVIKIPKLGSTQWTWHTKVQSTIVSREKKKFGVVDALRWGVEYILPRATGRSFLIASVTNVRKFPIIVKCVERRKLEGYRL